MITIEIPNIASHTISQKSYDDIIASLKLSDIQCPCGHIGGLIHHGSYERTVKAPDGEFRLRICRVKCTLCGHTHAILLSSIVPYSQISLKEQVAVIHSYKQKAGYTEILSSNLSIDENNIRSIILRYRRFWHQALSLFELPLYPISELIKQCFSTFQKQFMQIKNIPNSFIAITT